MMAYTGTSIIITHLDYSYIIRSSFWQTLEVVFIFRLLLAYCFFSYWQILTYYLINFSLHLSYLFFRNPPVKVIITFGLFLFYMGAKTSITAQELDHGSVENMLGGVHFGIDLFGHFYLLKNPIQGQI